MTHKNLSKIFLFFMCMSFFNLGGGKALAADWYVVSGDTGNEIKYFKASTTSYDVSNWSNANSYTVSTDLNTFLNDYNIVQSGDTVYIKAGKYKLSDAIRLGLQNNWDSPLYERNLHFYGGFAGDETTLSDRKLDANTTTLDANNSSKVLVITADSTIDGFTMTGGYGDNGGGIKIGGNSSPTIINCTITGNTANYNGGGGIYIDGNGNPEITNCNITGNTVNNYNQGGGIKIDSGSPTITNCTISGNYANYGGGIYINGNGNPEIINCTITGNNADDGGGIEIDNGTPTITNCTIVYNTVKYTDGYGYLGTEIYFNGGTTTLNNTLIWNTGYPIIYGENPVIIFNNCALYSGVAGKSTNAVILSAWENPVSSDITVNGVTHKVYKIFDNYEALQSIIKAGSHDVAPSFDQIGIAFANPPSIGAVEIILSVDITGTDTITAKYGTAKTETLTPIVSIDNEAFTTGYTVS